MSDGAAGSMDSAQQSPVSLALSASLSAAPKKVSFDEEVTVYIYPFHLNGPDADAVWGDKDVWEDELMTQGDQEEDYEGCDDEGFEKFVDESVRSSGSGSGCRSTGAEEEEDAEDGEDDEEEDASRGVAEEEEDSSCEGHSELSSEACDTTASSTTWTPPTSPGLSQQQQQQRRQRGGSAVGASSAFLSVEELAAARKAARFANPFKKFFNKAKAKISS